MDPHFSKYIESKTEGPESEDGNISMDPHISNDFSSESEGVEYEDQDVDRFIHSSCTEIPNWFNHRSVENSIFFWVGQKFPKLAICIAIVPKSHKLICHFIVNISINAQSSQWVFWKVRVHIECTCPPQESTTPNLPFLTAGHDEELLITCLTRMVAVEVTGRPQISFCYGCKLNLVFICMILCFSFYLICQIEMHNFCLAYHVALP
ncbi:hypothetical protein CFP56_019079 [Quercus suber]|uniref:Uncharacterized protein n=1 Tax=Quercus suber TaxID=58331 RepID=A0AAW0KIU3_QUESU